MFPPEFIPVEMRGISIITALIFFFLGVGGWFYFGWDRREHTRLQAHTTIEADDLGGKINTLFDKMDNSNKDISDIKAHIAGVHEAVDWIKTFMESKVK